jgi:hypothetical protein
MVRKLILAVVILAMAAVPVPALARDGGHGRGSHGASRSHGGHEFHGHGFHGGPERFEHFHGGFVGVYPYPYYAVPYYAYAPPACYWQPGYSVNQPYVDAWGRYTYVQQWVPAQYVCY